MIYRQLTESIINDLRPGHVTCLFGARRTGKTCLMSYIRNQKQDENILMVNGEDLDVASILSSRRVELLRSLVQGHEYLFIDEAQSIPDIGRNLKIIADTFQDLRIFITGSAAFDLKNRIGEPLTGRSKFFYLYPFSVPEIYHDYLSVRHSLESLLVTGMYPQVYLAQNDKDRFDVLDNIKNGYLLKDILQLDNMKDSVFILNLLRLIAFQIGNDISFNELAKNLSASVRTVQRYIDILEKTYIIFKISGFSRNLRKEFSKSPRIYFWDNGIRNSIISNFNALSLRDDTGRLWKNFCIAERLKRQRNLELRTNHYFWRTYDQQEIDLIEEVNATLEAFEFKWSGKILKTPKAFSSNYPEVPYHVINKDNFYEFLT